MSRVGKKPVTVPAGVNVTIHNRDVTIENGASKLSITHRPEVAVVWDAGKREIVCTIPEQKLRDKSHRAYWGTTRSLIQNMINGVTKGYQKKLEVVGVGWNANLQGSKLVLNLGYAKPVELPVPAGVKASVERQIITLNSPDKQLVGQFAATIRSKRKPEPYNGKGVKYTDETIIRKEGKTVVGR